MKNLIPRLCAAGSLMAAIFTFWSCTGDITGIDEDLHPSTRAGDYQLFIWPYDADWLTSSGIFDFTATTTDPNVMGYGSFEWDAYNGIVLNTSRNNASIYFPVYEQIREVSVRAYYNGEYSDWTRIGNRVQAPVFSIDFPETFNTGVPFRIYRVDVTPEEEAVNYYAEWTVIQNNEIIFQTSKPLTEIVSWNFTETGIGSVDCIIRHNDTGNIVDEIHVLRRIIQGIGPILFFDVEFPLIYTAGLSGWLKIEYTGLISDKDKFYAVWEYSVDGINVKTQTLSIDNIFTYDVPRSGSWIDVKCTIWNRSTNTIEVTFTDSKPISRL